MGVPLAPAGIQCLYLLHRSSDAFVSERLQAITGPLPDAIREACDLVIDATKSNGNFKIQTARARVLQNVISVAFLIDKEPSQPLPTFKSLEKWLNASSFTKSKLRDDVLGAFTRFMSLVLDPGLSKPITRIKLSPAEFIMIGYLVSLIGESCSDEEISGAIEKLRAVVRGAHTDIRTNASVFKTMFSFVNDFHNKLFSKTSRSLKRKRAPGDSENVGPSRKRTQAPTSSTVAHVSPKKSDPLAIVEEAKRQVLECQGVSPREKGIFLFKDR